MTKLYFSGINPSSAKGLHIGNYFGAAKPHVDFQKENKCIYFVANIHSLNTVHNKKEVEQNTMNVFTEYLAFGLNPEETLFFVESDVDEIAYLQTILNNVVTLPEMMRMHAFKDKMKDGDDHSKINIGLFSYPILMAADILAFKPDIIPVGEDQSQHVEIAREIARSFNNRYGEILKIPELYIQKGAARIKGIDGERKMSKSIGNDIPVFAPEKLVKKQIMKITTDPNRIHANDPGDPDKNIAFEYLKLIDFDSAKIEEMKDKYKTGNISDVEIKETLFVNFMDYFKEIRAKKNELEQNKDYLLNLRFEGMAKARKIAVETLDQVKKAVGFAKKMPKIYKKPEIQFDDFMKLDIRIGTIESAEQHPNADKLLKLIIDLGEEKRQLLAGIAEYKKPEDLVGKQIPIIFNLASREMRGLESQGMILAADDGEGIALLHPETELPNGSLVR